MALSVYGLSSQALATPAKQPESLKDKPRPFNPEGLAPSPMRHSTEEILEALKPTVTSVLRVFTACALYHVASRSLQSFDTVLHHMSWDFERHWFYGLRVQRSIDPGLGTVAVW